MRWTRRRIIEEIRELHGRGEELNYAAAEENHLVLVRAAAWHFGTWRRAVERAGLDYEIASKYRRWTRERVLARIRELHTQGHDLSWRVISSEVDPPLAAAAVRSNLGFGSWHDAVTAAGLKYDLIARYRHWTPARVVDEIRELAEQGAPLSSKLVQQNHPPLYNAAKRRFGQWDAALEAAGVDPQDVRQRRAAPDLRSHRRRRNPEGELSFAHLEREDLKKRRRQPQKSLSPIPPQPEKPLVAARLEPLPMRRAAPKGRPRKPPPRSEIVALERETNKRTKILARAAQKQGLKPEKSGHARRRELLEREQEKQLALELGLELPAPIEAPRAQNVSLDPTKVTAKTRGQKKEKETPQ